MSPFWSLVLARRERSLPGIGSKRTSTRAISKSGDPLRFGLLSPGLAAKTTCVIPFSSRRPQTTERFGGGQNPVLHFAAFFAGLPSKGQEIERQIAV